MTTVTQKASNKQFLFLIDFSIESLKSLTYLINFVKTTGGTIELLYSFEQTNLKNELESTEVKAQEIKIEKKLLALKEIIEVENIAVKTGYSYQDLEVEINLKSDQLKENLVVVIDAESKGKIKESTKFLINSYLGSVLIVNSSSEFDNGNSIVLSGDCNALNKSDLSLTNSLCSELNSPLIVLESVRRNESKSFTYSPDTKFEVYYNPISEHKTLADLKKYITNNSIRLLGLCREKTSKSLLKKFFHTNKSVLEIVKNINTPILILNNNFE